MLFGDVIASPTPAWLPEGLILACLSVAVATDVARRIIPNRLVLLVLACGIALRLLSAPGNLWPGILGPVAVLLGLGLLAGRDLIGWGDAKLITALSVAVPAERLLILLLAIAMAGGVLSCVYIAARFALRWGAQAAGGGWTAEPAGGSAVLVMGRGADGRVGPGHDGGVRISSGRTSGVAAAAPFSPAHNKNVDAGEDQPGAAGHAGEESPRSAAMPLCLASLHQVLRAERDRILASEPLPYAVAILGGALYTFATG